MSLILDALNRADTERKNQAPVPDLNTQHRALPFAPEVTTTRWPWLIALVLLVFMVGLLVWYWQRHLSEPVLPVVAPNAVVSHSSVPVVVEVPAKISPQPVASLADAAAVQPESALAAADVSSLYAQESVTPELEQDVDQLYAPEEAIGSESIVDPFAGAAATPAPQSAAAPAPEPAPIEREAARTFADSPVQDFNELPWNTKQKMPTISYQRHDYLPGGISSVVINGQTLGVGNIAANGQFVVQDILVDGVVLKHGDYVFKLRALNGWINM